MMSLAPHEDIIETDENGIKYTRTVPVQVRYQRIMSIIEGTSPAAKKHKKKLLGSDTDFITSDTYNIISAGREVAGTYMEFMSWDIHDRAKILAQLFLSNMVDLVRRHDDIVAENIDRRRREIDSKNQSTAK